ncbi:putative mucin-6 [Sesbania bispinosa]|nr:putative mucin-6 [Sesbania bispinosa]
MEEKSKGQQDAKTHHAKHPSHAALNHVHPRKGLWHIEAHWTAKDHTRNLLLHYPAATQSHQEDHFEPLGLNAKHRSPWKVEGYQARRTWTQSL